MLVAGARQDAARRRAPEMTPALAVPIFEREDEALARIRPRDHGRIGERELDRDVRLGGLEQLVAREVQDAVDLGILAERIEVLAEIEHEERAVVEVRVGVGRQQALADDLDARAHGIDLGVLGRLGTSARRPRIHRPSM